MGRNNIRSLVLFLISVISLCRCSMCVSALEHEQILSGPQIRMDISEIGIHTKSFAIEQPFDCFLRSDIPDDIVQAQQYSITQTLPIGLNLEADSLAVTFLTGAGREISLEMGRHYILTTGTIEEENCLKERISASLTPAGLAYVAAHMEEGICQRELQLTYKLAINRSAPVGCQLVTMAQLNYHSQQIPFHLALSNKTAVYTGGLNILLTDAGNNPLPGGAFLLARPLAGKDGSQQETAAELLDTGEEQIAVVYETFFTTEEFSGEKTASAITDNRGRATLYGIPFGTYYLVQTGTRDGVTRRSLPLEVTVNEVSHLTIDDGWENGHGVRADYTVHIQNESAVIPETGGPGTAAMEFTGKGILLNTCLYQVLHTAYKKKKRRK